MNSSQLCVKYLNMEFYTVYTIITLINFQDYFCSFTCLTKGSLSEIKSIIESERYLSETKYSDFKLNIADILIRICLILVYKVLLINK